MLRDRELFDLARWHGVGVSELLLQIRRAQLGPVSASLSHGAMVLPIFDFDDMIDDDERGAKQ
jgi:hypothetical protein